VPPTKNFGLYPINVQRSRDELRERFGVTRLALFGSVARDSASDSSDIDILVGFDGPATSKRFFGVQFFLEDLMGCSIDLVTDKALRPELRPYVERSLIDV
jgi:predicted nucleotidyltransferase